MRVPVRLSRGRVAWAALALVLAVGAFSTGSAVAYQLLAGVVAVPLAGLGYAWLAVRRLEGGVRRVTPYLQVGAVLEEELALRSVGWWPRLLLEVRHRTSPFGADGRVVSLWSYREAAWRAVKRAERRGVYRYGVLEVTARDPLGLFARTARVGEPQSVLVFPATVDLPGFHVPSGLGWTEGARRGRTFSPSPQAASVREYVAGDAFSHIHWPATAHAGHLMVKEYEREPSGPAEAVWVLLDLDARVQAGTGAESSVEYAVTVAASAARRFLDAGRPVGLSIAGSEHTLVRPAEGLEQLGRVLHALAVAEPGTVLDLEGLAASAAGMLTAGASAVVVSAAPLGQMASAVRTLQATGAGVVPVLVDAGSFRQDAAPHGGGAVRLPGTGLEAFVVGRGDELEAVLDERVRPVVGR
jgi:uncharacterized protein (DUF58 family)